MSLEDKSSSGAANEEGAHGHRCENVIWYQCIEFFLGCLVFKLTLSEYADGARFDKGYIYRSIIHSQTALTRAPVPAFLRNEASPPSGGTSIGIVERPGGYDA